jgi:predicted peptidase
VENLKSIELLFDGWHDREQFPCYVVASQCPKSHPKWVSGPSEEEPLTILKAIVDGLLKELPIDDRRIYITGLSSGGDGAWEMMLRHPELFAAGAPLASAGSQRADISALKGIPIWTFHVRADPGVSVLGVRQTVQRLQQQGGKACLTETPGTSHDCWRTAFRDFRIMDWLLAQEKGMPGPTSKHSRLGIQFALLKQSILEAELQWYLGVPVMVIATWYVCKWHARRR